MSWDKLESSWVTLSDGSKVHYHEHGDGHPVVLVHGSGAGVSAALNWWKNIEPLAGSYRVIAPDLPGFGQTEAPQGAELGVKLWATFLRDFSEALDLGPATFVGNSLGGWVGVHLAVDHPDVVSHLVLMGTGGVPGEISAQLKRSQDGLAEITRDDVRRQLSNFVVDKSIIDDALVDARYAAMTAPGALERFNATAAARKRDRAEHPLTEELLAQVTAPTLAVHGRDDAVIPPERSWFVANHIPDSELHILSRCGHWTQVERADDFNHLVDWFVS